MKTLIIASWGRPKSRDGRWLWKEARYISEDRRYLINARSSLALLTHMALEEGITPHILIIAPDTLFTSTNAPTPKTYHELLRAVESWLRECTREMGEETGLKPIEEAEITILPGIGRFKRGDEEYVFQAQLSNFRILSYLKILRHLIEGGFQEIWIDLTHGINYSTTLTYQSTIDALESLALYEGLTAEETKDKLKVYNSDPYDPAKEEGQELILHEIKSTTFTSINLPKIKDLKRNLKSKNPISKLLKIEAEREEAKRIAAIKKELLKTQDEAIINKSKSLLTTIGAMEKGIIPPLKIIFNPEQFRKVNEIISDLYEWIYKTMINEEISTIEKSGRIIKIRRCINLKNELIQLTKSLCLANHISKIICEKSEWAKLSELKETLEKLSKWISGTVVTISKIEYGNIAMKTIDKLRGNEIKLKELEDGIMLSKIIYGEEPFKKRNFIAHGGLERTITKIRLKGKINLEEGNLINKAMEFLEVTYTDEGMQRAYKAIIDPDP